MIDEILKGNVPAAARLMSDIDDRLPSAREVMKELFPHTGRARVVGITGVPGAGKSTLVDQLISEARLAGLTVGIVTIDPTSPFSHGAVLGDRVRMQRHSTDEGVFIRSLATRGHLGGVSRSTYDIVDVFDAMGRDLIIVETVGVGQDEVDIMRLAHTTIVVQVPGMGDEVQAIKSGILEVGDIFVVNKGDLDGAEKTVAYLEMMLGLKTYHDDSWRPKVLRAQATDGVGINEIMDEIELHAAFVNSDRQGELAAMRMQTRLVETLRDDLLNRAMAKIGDSEEWSKICEDLDNRFISPYEASDLAMALFFDMAKANRLKPTFPRVRPH